MNNRLVKYIASSLVLSWLFMLYGCYFNMVDNTTIYNVFIYISMFMPTVSAIICGIKFNELSLAPAFKKNFKYYALAWLLPQGLMIIGALLFYLLVPNAFDINGSFVTSLYGKEDIQAIYDNGIDIKLYALIEFASGITLGTFLQTLLGVGQEIGLRKVLYPELKNKFDKTTSRIIGGIIWGLYYLPILVFAGYKYGTNYKGYPFIGVVIYIIFSICYGIILDYINEKSTSIWTSSLALGSINAATCSLVFLNVKFANSYILGPTPTGLIAMIPIICVAILLIRSENK